MQNSRALGKGLASLIPIQEPSAQPIDIKEDNASYFQCPVSRILPAKDQPRKIFSKESLEELAASIKEQGIIQPLIVRGIEGGNFELIAGERRLRASKLAGLEKVPVVVSEVVPEKVFELALIENIQRQDLNPIEEALGYRELQKKYALTQDDIAERVGKNRSTIANSLRLLTLGQEIRAEIIKGNLSMGHARALLALESLDKRIQITKRVVKDGLSVRDVERLVREAKQALFITPRRAPRLDLEPQLKDLQNKMTQRLGTKVTVQPKGERGKIVIEYYNTEELDRIFETIIGHDDE